MPEFHLDTDGAVDAAPGSGLTGAIHFHDDLDAFTQGYIEALFFTGVEGPESDYKDGDFVEANATGFSDLAPEALASIIEDCRAFLASQAWRDMRDAFETLGGDRPDDAQAGRDFWYTRNGHGCGFWDGDWPEPYASALTAASKAFRETDAYLGDDGKVYLS